MNNQFRLMRKMLLDEIKETNPALFDIQPEGFNNTIHWHIGHVLTVGEQFLLGYPESNNLPANYATLFGYGSKPADWTGDVPSVETLVQQLQEQLVRLNNLPEEKFNEKLPQPFLGIDSIAGMANLLVVHEANHTGQIHAMKRILAIQK